MEKILNDINLFIKRKKILDTINEQFPTSVFTDPDNDPLTLAITKKPYWIKFENNILSGTADVIGDHQICIESFDGWDSVVWCGILNVKELHNSKSEINIQIPDETKNASTEWTFYINIEKYFKDDDEDDVLTLTVLFNADWLHFSDNTFTGFIPK